MRKRTIYAAAAIAAAMGLSLPGCSVFEPNAWEGRICASPVEGGDYCVSRNRDPAVAFENAARNGHAPIQMWADLPNEVRLDEVIKSPQSLGYWYEDIDKVLRYLREGGPNAESYRASLNGRQGELLRAAHELQVSLLSQTEMDAVGIFKADLIEKANAEKAPLVAEIASDKSTMGEVQLVLATSKTDAKPLSTAFVKAFNDFADYRATEAAEAKMYKDLATSASNASLAELDGIESSILNAAHDASGKPVPWTTQVLKLAAEIQQLENKSNGMMAPYESFMSTHGAAFPDMTSGALRSLNAMLGYAARRVARSDSTALSLLIGIRMRRKALEMLDASPLAKAEMAEARLQMASGEFSTLAQERISPLMTMPVSSKLGLPFLAKRYDDLKRALQLLPLCDPATSSWREQGCTSIREKAKDATTEMTTTLALLLANGLSIMKAKGVDAALLNAADAKLKAGDIKGAAMLHDAALRIAEGT